MPDRLWNIEWPNCNTQRRYPLMEGQEIKDGNFELPNDLIVDLVIPVNTGAIPTVDPTKFHLAQVGVFSSGVTVSLAYNGVVFSTVSIPTAGFVEYSTYSVIGVTPFFDVRGWLTIGKLSTVLEHPGAWNFTLATARIVPSVIRPNIRAVTSIRVVNGQDTSDPMTGDITLLAGSNFRFRVDPILNQIFFDCIDGNGLDEDCVCTNVDQKAPCIRTINGVAPDSSGNLTLRGTTCVTLTTQQNAIVIGDSCAEPCCDCRELKVVTDQLSVILSDMQSLEMTAIKMDGVISNLGNNILVSKSTGIPR